MGVLRNRQKDSEDSCRDFSALGRQKDTHLFFFADSRLFEEESMEGQKKKATAKNCGTISEGEKSDLIFFASFQ
ncbi:hypothetical protein TNCT_91981 [Trichonephila clavata]|uniref:Uncharacterized protein n=1 Tax=Trichonephila clavata TaxID=2740835 RepID=A0A8X6KMH0_TRICU|nr:hypothetical protein TNCT_91981 [Trichonephila clavata]